MALEIEGSNPSSHPNMEGSHSGRVRLPRKQKARKGPRVRIPFLPPRGLRKGGLVMDFPHNCADCGFRNSCNSGMYQKGCHFFAPEDKPKKKTPYLMRFFSKIFA